MRHGRLLLFPADRSGRHVLLVAFVAVMVMLVGPLATSQATPVPPSCGAPVSAGSNDVVTCSYTDGAQSFTVPAGVSKVSIDVRGAQGGNGDLGFGAPGGDEGGDLTVSSGEVLKIAVGGQGGSYSGPTGSSGGYGGGGSGGSGTYGGGGGGGGSFVFDGSDNLVLAAGGGGGGGTDSCGGANAGSGGGDTGGSSGCGAATGGTQSGGGTGPGGPGGGPANWSSGPGSGGAGNNQTDAGGGGGGGYYGGGGGDDYGGGGGSGYCAAAVSGCYQTMGGGSTGNGVVTITYATPTAPAITSADQTTFTVGQSGSFTVDTRGVPTASLSESGSLPGGVTFTGNGDGTATLSGTPAAGTAGSYPITITASNGVSPDATQSFMLTVNQAPAVTSAASTTFTTGQADTFTATTSGYPTPTLSESGALPSGVTFADNGDGTGTLSGTPASDSEGTYTFQIRASNGVYPDATQTFTLTVDQPPSITSADHTAFNAGQASHFSITTGGLPSPALSETGTLPSGVTFTDNGDGTATLSGTPATGTAGSYPFTITATNGKPPDATQRFTLTVEGPPSASISQPSSGGVYGLGQVVAVSFSCQEGTDGPGIQSCTDSNHDTDRLDTSSVGSHTFTVTAKSADGQRATASISYRVVGPHLSKMKISPKRFTAKRGATISYSDPVKAKTTFRIYRKQAGVRQLVRIGSFTHADAAGVNRVRFSGRLKGRTLRPGHYRLKATATLDGHASRPVTVNFTIRS